MEDIKKRKSKVINLKGKKIKVKVPVKVHIDNPIASEPKSFESGTFPCVDCGVQEAIEFGRCRTCDAEHRKVVARLDATPRQVIEKVPPKLTYRKEVSGGVVVTISTSEPIKG